MAVENEEIEKKNIDETESSNFSIAQNIETEQNIDGEKEIDVSTEIAEEKLSEALSTQKPQKRKKRTIVSLILLLINIIFMTVVVKSLVQNIGEQDFISYIQSQGSKLWWLVGSIACYIIYMFSQSMMFHALIKNLTGKSRWKLSYDVGITGKYYDNITPFAVGGQPMQIVRLANTGISPGISTSIPLMKMIMNSFTSTLLGLIFFIVGIPKIAPTNEFYSVLFVIFEILGIIGLAITTLWVVLMIMLSVGNLFTRSLIAGIVKIGYKLKLIKNYRLTLKKWLDQVSEYRSSMTYLFKNKWLLVRMLLYSCLESLSYACVSFFVVMAFIDPSYMTSSQNGAWFILFSCVVKYYICSMAGSYIPLPGATGIMEIAFIALYGEFVGDAIVWALLTWRLISYYLILIHGFVHEIVGIIKNVSVQKKTSDIEIKEE